MKKILYIIRTEADFERVVCLAIAGKEKYDQHFLFVGDLSPFFNDGILNEFQKELFNRHGFVINDFFEFSFWGRFLKKMSGGVSISIRQFSQKKRLFVSWLFNEFLRRYIASKKEKIILKVLQSIKPNVLLTDQSLTNSDYIPQIFRNTAIQMQIPVYIFTHGAAAGLHSKFSEFSFDAYDGCTVLACSENEPRSKDTNRIILGDMSSSYPYVHFINQQNICEINFLNDRKYKIGFLVGGTIFTSTNGWNAMQEMIIDNSENSDVAMVLKLHPREAPFIDLRMLKKFNNLLIVSRETDRSRVTKWADIVVCSDHCSTIFEPMILGKKVVAIGSKHIPKYRNTHSPIKHSSVMHISSADEFDLINIPDSDPEDSVINTVAWGGNGTDDLSKKAINLLAEE
ncbi:hypothetical protein N9M20_00150 [Gammaproteobacteria bacterium]|nr:hypothetical protein [Gammaproteobacteria bacterium]